VTQKQLFQPNETNTTFPRSQLWAKVCQECQSTYGNHAALRWVTFFEPKESTLACVLEHRHLLAIHSLQPKIFPPFVNQLAIEFKKILISALFVNQSVQILNNINDVIGKSLNFYAKAKYYGEFNLRPRLLVLHPIPRYHFQIQHVDQVEAFHLYSPTVMKFQVAELFVSRNRLDSRHL